MFCFYRSASVFRFTNSKNVVGVKVNEGKKLIAANKKRGWVDLVGRRFVSRKVSPSHSSRRDLFAGGIAVRLYIIFALCGHKRSGIAFDKK